MKDDARIERLISMAERLIAALESDIAALKAGAPNAMQSQDPEIQRLSATYGREAHGFDIRIAQAAPPSLRERFLAITGKFRDVLQMHARLLARMKNASEGMVQAIAREVDRMNQPTRTYGARPAAMPVSAGAMLFNRVV